MDFKLKLPATSANLGLGFDSMGLALNLYMNLKVSQSSRWNFNYIGEKASNIPLNHKNLIAHTAIKVAGYYDRKMPGLTVEVDSQIPMARGLGSSSSAIVAGIELANHYCQLGLSQEDKLRHACEIEAHPDNVGPCITGGGFVGAYVNGELYYESFTLSEDLACIVTTPDYEVLTEAARNVMPEHYHRRVAVEQNALNNVMIMLLLKGNYPLMGELMMQDRYHENFRRPLVKEFEIVKSISLSQGAYASVISGSGPTILTLCHQDQALIILDKLKEVKDCQHLQLKVHYENDKN